MCTLSNGFFALCHGLNTSGPFFFIDDTHTLQDLAQFSISAIIRGQYTSRVACIFIRTSPRWPLCSSSNIFSRQAVGIQIRSSNYTQLTTTSSRSRLRYQPFHCLGMGSGHPLIKYSLSCFKNSSFPVSASVLLRAGWSSIRFT